MARAKYETIQYQPPTPQVFGNAAPDDLPKVAPNFASYSADRPRNRPKLQDRLAVYEDDDPSCQRYLCVGGFGLPVLWIVGAFMYFRTPSNKILTREVGFKNVILAMSALVVGIFLLVFILVRHYTTVSPRML